MTEQEFLEKYVSAKLKFSNVYKHRVTYINEDLRIWCKGDLECRDSVNLEETVNSIFQLDNFEFGTINEDSQHKQITGWNTMEEYMAYDKGREDEHKVLCKWIEKWDGKTNSVMGQLLHDKMDELFSKSFINKSDPF